MEPVKARLRSKNYGIEIDFKTPQDGITPGQAVVFFDKDQTLGGATIEKAL